jgi:DNA-binding NarL/FixJ family response regulator
MTIRILIADDHGVVRQGLRMFLALDVREVRTPDAAPATLSGRATEGLQLIARGKADREIAAELTIGEKTVKTHVSSILNKLGVRSRTQAALYAAQSGIVPLSESA